MYVVARGIGAALDDDSDRAAELGMTRHEQWLRHREEQEDNFGRFILDPEQTMKYIFSGYFYKYGLIK